MEPATRRSLLAIVCAVAVFVALTVLVAADADLGWDEPVTDLVDALVPISETDVHINPFVTAVTVAAGAVVAFVVASLLLRRRLRAALFPVLALAGAVLLNTAVKEAVQRPAIEGPGYSFPSGNAAWSMAIVVALALLAQPSGRQWLLVAAGAAVVVVLAAAIVWERWHYPSDVLAGWCLALGWTLAVWLALGRPGGLGGTSLVAGVRWSFRGKDAGSAQASQPERD